MELEPYLRCSTTSTLVRLPERMQTKPFPYATMPMEGFKGYRIVPEIARHEHQVIAPSGTVTATIDFGAHDEFTVITHVKDLDCGEEHPTEEHALRYLARQHLLLTTTRWERVRGSVSGFFGHGGWGAN